MARPLLSLLLFALTPALLAADKPPVIDGVDGQPLAANAERLAKALDFLGTPLPADVAKTLTAAVEAKDAKRVQEILDPRVLFVVNINPESRVKAARGPAEAVAQQAGHVPLLVKVVNESTVKKPLKATSPQSGPRYSDAGKDAKPRGADAKIADRFLQVEVFTSPPMTADLSGLKVEYAVVLLYSTEAGKREATIGFDVGQGNQDLGFRGEVPVLFDVKPAVPVRVKIQDADGTPTTARFTFTDAAGHVFPPQAKRLAPDLFFQQQVYRHDGGTVLLPPGAFTVQYGRGPEYKLKAMKFSVPAGAKEPSPLAVKLERWIDPAKLGWYSGDHHIHAAGCAHYTNPTEGVNPEDMFLHVKGEGMHVGCCLTWGPCYDFQRRFFDSKPWEKSEPFTVLKYDVEVSGFGSQALGHVCLLNLRDQTYPGSDGTKTKGWPTWTTPLMRWAKEQGGVTGYAHSANGLGINP
ncbi:MAG: CehA/McbA family metallohydrolase, partial [Gemmataceae bacterium]